MIDMTSVAREACVHFDVPHSFPNEKTRPWVALLIDGDGLDKTINIKMVIEKASQMGEVVVRRIYGNAHVPKRFTRWMQISQEFQFVRRIFVGVHKNIADMAIVSDAIELALVEPTIDYFVIVSHDGGFFPLFTKLSELGKKSYWIGGAAPLRKAEKLQEDLLLKRAQI